MRALNLFFAGRILARPARCHVTSPLSHRSLVLFTVSLIVSHRALVRALAGDIFAVGRRRTSAGTPRSPSLCITGITRTYSCEFLQIELTDHLTVTRPRGCAAHRWIVRVVRQCDGRYHRRDNYGTDNSIDPHFSDPSQTFNMGTGVADHWAICSDGLGTAHRIFVAVHRRGTSSKHSECPITTRSGLPNLSSRRSAQSVIDSFANAFVGHRGDGDAGLGAWAASCRQA